MKKLLPALLLGVALLPAASYAQVYVQVGPPAPIVERRPVAPGREFVWIDGYHRYDGRAYAWVPGRWEQPPRAHARWERHRWSAATMSSC